MSRICRCCISPPSVSTRPICSSGSTMCTGTCGTTVESGIFGSIGICVSLRNHRGEYPQRQAEPDQVDPRSRHVQRCEHERHKSQNEKHYFERNHEPSSRIAATVVTYDCGIAEYVGVVADQSLVQVVIPDRR